MTNRERIMTELAEMNDQDLHNTLTNDNDSRLMDRLCFACEKQHWRDVTRHPAKAGNGTAMTEFHSAAHYESWERRTNEGGGSV